MPEFVSAPVPLAKTALAFASEVAVVAVWVIAPALFSVAAPDSETVYWVEALEVIEPVEVFTSATAFTKAALLGA